VTLRWLGFEPTCQRLGQRGFGRAQWLPATRVT
jgi:hypothetical protein